MKRLTAVIIITLAALLAWPLAAFCDGPKVAVFPVKNNGQSSYDGLAAGLSSMIANDLTKDGALDVADQQAVKFALKQARMSGGAPGFDDSMAAAKLLTADYAVTGEFVVFGGKFRIDIRVYDVKTGTVKAVEKAQAKEDAFFDSIDQLADRVVTAIVGELPKAGGTLVVETDPAGANLTLDEEKVGETPFTKKDLKPGQHEVTVELEGYKTATQKVTLTEKDTTRVTIKLVKLYGGIRVWWKAGADSDVGVGDVKVPMTIYQLNALGRYCRNMPAGSYTVTARMPYKDESSWEPGRTWKTYAADVDIRPGEVVDIYLRNDLYTPGIEVNSCGQCATNWDFKGDLTWYETW